MINTLRASAVLCETIVFGWLVSRACKRYGVRTELELVEVLKIGRGWVAP